MAAGGMDNEQVAARLGTRREVGVFAASHLAPSAAVVSDGLRCFRAITLVGAGHERHVTGGGQVSVKLPQFGAVNTLPGNLKTAIAGTYHAVDFNQVRASLPCRVPAPLHLPLRHEIHAVSLAPRPRRRAGFAGALAAGAEVSGQSGQGLRSEV